MIKKYFVTLLNIFVFVAAVIFTHTNTMAQAQNTATQSATYAQLSSKEDQVASPDSINTPTVVIMENQDAISNMGWDPKTNELIIKKDGVYFIAAVAQAGSRESAKNIIKGGDIYLWAELNKKTIPNSNTWTFAAPTARAKSLVNQMVIPLKAGDRLRTVYSSSSPSMGLITFPATEKWPASPGITLTVFKIG